MALSYYKETLRETALKLATLVKVYLQLMNLQTHVGKD